MATTWLKPLHMGKGRSMARALSQITDYGKNPEKTDNGRLVTGYACDPATVAAEFLLSKRQYRAVTGRDQGKEHDVIVYHTRQAFPAGELSAEEANQIGHELAQSLTKGKHAFIVNTHIDQQHYHNHIYINSVSLDYSRKFRNFKNSAWALRRISDRICLEHGLSIIENPKPSRNQFEKWRSQRQPSKQEQLRWAIDDALAKKPKDFEDFIRLVEEQGYTAKRGKHLKFTAKGSTKGTRCDTLKGDYTEEAVRERIEGKRVVFPRLRSKSILQDDKKINLLIDIQAKLQAGKGAGYARWAKVFNLKQAAKTLLYLQERGLTDYDDLAEKSAAASTAFHDCAKRIKGLEGRMTANAAMQKHIVNYSKTRDVYTAYRKAGYSKKFRAEHEPEILLHQASKKAFDELGGKTIPSVAALRKEYAVLLAEKNKAYAIYKTAKKEMQELSATKANVDAILSIPAITPAEKGEKKGR